ncbi:MAG: hypothetical protein HEQ13_17190 [Dolichospermum sp. DEX189]|nr:hypothetical protein [Dolichospermum sp. DEX189]
MARQEALMQEARVKRVWAILLFFTQIGFIVFTYLSYVELRFSPSPCEARLY